MPNRDRRCGRFNPAVRVGSLRRLGNKAPRGMVIDGGEPPGQNPAYRPSARLLFEEPSSTPAAYSFASRAPVRDAFRHASGGSILARMKKGSPPCPGRIHRSDCNRARGLHPGRRVALQLPARDQLYSIVVNEAFHPFILEKTPGGAQRGGRAPGRAEERLPQGARRRARYPLRDAKKSCSSAAESCSPIPPYTSGTECACG